MEPIKLTLKLAKETTGTYVYTMVTEGGLEAGKVYLPKLLFKVKPGNTLNMSVTA